MIILEPTIGDKTISIIPRSMNVEGAVSLRIRRDGDGSAEEVFPLSVTNSVNYIEIIFPNDNGLLKEDSTYLLEVLKDDELWYRDKIYATSQSKSDMALNSHQIGNGDIYKPYNEFDDNTYIITETSSIQGATGGTTVSTPSTGGTVTQNKPPSLRWNFNEPLDVRIGSIFSYQIRSWYNPTSITIENIPEGLSCSVDGLISGTATGENRLAEMTIVMVNSYGESRDLVEVNLSDDLPLNNPLRAEFSYVQSPATGNGFASGDGVNFAYNAVGNQFNSEISFPSDGSPMVLWRPTRINYIRIGIPFSFRFDSIVNIGSEYPITNTFVNRVIDGLVFLYRKNTIIGIVTGEPRTETIEFTVENALGSTTETFEFKIIEDEGTEIAYPPENLADNGSSETYLRFKWDERFYNGDRVWEFVNVYMNGELYAQRTYNENSSNTDMLYGVQGFNEVQLSYVDTEGVETGLSPEGVFLKMKGQGYKPQIITDSDRVYYIKRYSDFQLDIITDIDALNVYEAPVNTEGVPQVNFERPISGTIHSLEGRIPLGSTLEVGFQWNITFQFLGDDSRGDLKTFTLEVTDSDPTILNPPPSMGYSIDNNGVIEINWIEGQYNGTISETELYQDDVLIRRVFNNELNYSIQGLSTGTYNFKTRHKDDEGNFSPYSNILTLNI